MRIVIDLQAAQAENRHRGIGRYSMALALSIARNKKSHEIFVVLNGAFPESIGPIRAAFKGLIPTDSVCVWSASDTRTLGKSGAWQHQAAIIVRDAFLASLRPDVVLISSLFEGFGGDAVTDIAGVSLPCLKAVILYDLIPFVHPDIYLINADFSAWYTAKIDDLKRADCWFSISEFSQREGIEALALPKSRVVPIGTDADKHFKKISIAAEEAMLLQNRHKLTKPFVMYTGGIDHRKNIPALIRSYASLPAETRKSHQLAIVCAISDADRHALDGLAKDCGLGSSDVIFTGFVSEDDLVGLYNLCKLFVFPSWHEGFGLPALEAMRCGAPVIAGNLSSLPEVVGWDEALFNPHSDASITAKLLRGIEDAAFRQDLIANGEQQARKFSWDLTGQKLVSALEGHLAKELAQTTHKQSGPLRKKLAYVSPLPPERSGIADYSAELLPYLAEFYEIDVIVTQKEVIDPWINNYCKVRDAKWLVTHANDYSRVVYHFGNSAYHQHMFDLIEQVPGIVVLHDFFLSGLVSLIDGSGMQPGLLDIELYRSHGYYALKNRSDSSDPAEAIWKFPCNLRVIQNSLGTIVHSENSLQLCRQWYNSWPNDWEVIPLLRTPYQNPSSKTLVRKSLGFKSNDFVVCSFGLLGPTKLNHRLVDAWLNSALAESEGCYLIFVGENDKTPYGKKLSQRIKDGALKDNIRITGWTDANLFRDYLTVADLGVQLRTLSRGETSAAVLDCMNYGIPTIINNNGSLADISNAAALKLPDNFSDAQLIEALENLWRNDALRDQFSESARELILKQHTPERCADKYYSAIERFYEHSMLEAPGIPNRIARISDPYHNAELFELAEQISITFAPQIRQPQLLVDVSELVQRDAQSGIQRVVKRILREWLNAPPCGYRVEPVYASSEDVYRYAHQFTLDFLGCANATLTDEPIDFSPGDILFVLDLQPTIQVAQASYYQHLRNYGVTVKFMVYDLLCVTMPQYFSQGADTDFAKWLSVVANSDGAICISETVSNELAQWIKSHQPERMNHFDNRWFHLGADFDNSVTSRGFPPGSREILNKLQEKPSFLMVGTIEPRKGHEQILDAFELLWHSDVDVNLTIVGKPGWLIERFVNRLRTHAQSNKNLFWINGASDECLQQIYRVSDCLIGGSYGEGFGLPLIEAAHYSLPIFARDISIFREVAGDNAYYFKADNPEDLANDLRQWLTLYKNHAHPSSKGLLCKPWVESAQWLANELLHKPEDDSYGSL